MKKKVSSLLVALFPFGALGLLTSCAGTSAATVITTAEAAVTDGEIFLSTIEAGAAAYFLAKPNPTLQAQIANAEADAQSALRDVNTALAGAASFTDGNVQAALQSFSQAFASLMALAQQIGIQLSTSAETPRRRLVPTPGGGFVIAPPTILRSLATAPRS